MRVVLLQDGSWWIAQAIEHDFVGQGKTVDGALKELATVIACRLAWGDYYNIPNVLDSIPPAPLYCREWFDTSQFRMTVREDHTYMVRASFEGSCISYSPKFEIRFHDRHPDTQHEQET